MRNKPMICRSNEHLLCPSVSQHIVALVLFIFSYAWWQCVPSNQLRSFVRDNRWIINKRWLDGSSGYGSYALSWHPVQMHRCTSTCEDVPSYSAADFDQLAGSRFKWSSTKGLYLQIHLQTQGELRGPLRIYCRYVSIAQVRYIRSRLFLSLELQLDRLIISAYITHIWMGKYIN